MHKDKLEEFLNGELNLEDFKEKTENHSVERDFVDSFEKLVETNNEQLPDFNPFAKIAESDKKRRYNIFRSLLPFAATLLLLIGIFSVFIISKSQQKIENSEFSEQQIIEMRETTEYALLYFSKEFNSSLKKINDAKKISQPFEEFQKLKDVKIEFNNPLKNLKFN